MGPWPHGNPTTQASSPCPADDWSADADGPHPYSKSPTGGVYALWRRPHPSRPHVRVPWPDFGLPLDSRQARAAIDQALQLSTHHRVEIAYGGGRDRTDTILATLACHEGLEPEAAIRWVREHYDAHAVETPWQRRWVRASRKGGEAR